MKDGIGSQSRVAKIQYASELSCQRPEAGRHLKNRMLGRKPSRASHPSWGIRVDFVAALGVFACSASGGSEPSDEPLGGGAGVGGESGVQVPPGAGTAVTGGSGGATLEGSGGALIPGPEPTEPVQTAPLPTGPAPFRLSIVVPNVAPGEEGTQCIQTRLPNAEPISVTQLHNTVSAGSHHFIVSALTAANATEMPLSPCKPFRAALQGGPLAITQKHDDTVVTPPGVHCAVTVSSSAVPRTSTVQS